jgi:predicted amidohydrolase YtcJ
MADALCGFTAGSAYVNYLEADRGSIVPGAVADLVVLEDNPFETTDASEIRVDLTIIDGEIVYRRT